MMSWPKGKPKPLEFRQRVSSTLVAQRGRIVICAYCGKPFKPWWGKSKYCTLMIGKYNPDFANCNGKKQLIEVYGEYWHSSRNKRLTWDKTELGRMMAYNSLGFRCLVLWENELGNEEVVVAKIRQFTEGK